MGKPLLQGDLQRRYDTRVGRCFQTVCVFGSLISYGFLLIFFSLTHSFLSGPWRSGQRSPSFFWDGGAIPKTYSDEGGHAERNRIMEGGYTIFKLHSSKSHRPPVSHKKWTVPYIYLLLNQSWGMSPDVTGNECTPEILDVWIEELHFSQ